MTAAKSANVDRMLIGARRPPFDSVTIRFHWATVLIVLAMFATAWLHSMSHDDAVKAILLQTHRSLGVTIWVATVLRLTWRLTNAKLPPFPIHMTNMHRAIVKVGEYCLYALLLIQPATGLAHTLFRGHQFALFFWWIPPLVPADAALRDAFMLAHQLGAYAFGALVIGHAGAALFHHFVLRDDVLQCMAPVMPAERPNLSRASVRADDRPSIFITDPTADFRRESKAASSHTLEDTAKRLDYSRQSIAQRVIPDSVLMDILSKLPGIIRVGPWSRL